MNLIAVFLFSIVLLITTITSITILLERKNIKSFRYVILWVLWLLSISLKVFAEISLFHGTPIGMSFGIAGLWVNSYAYVHLLSIFKSDSGKYEKLSHIAFGLQSMLWVGVSLFITENAFPMAFFNSALISTMVLYAFKRKRWWFAITGIFTGLFFFFTGIALSLGFTSIPFLWILTAIGALTAIKGTIVNGHVEHVAYVATKKKRSHVTRALLEELYDGKKD